MITTVCSCSIKHNCSVCFFAQVGNIVTPCPRSPWVGRIAGYKIRRSALNAKFATGHEK